MAILPHSVSAVILLNALQDLQSETATSEHRTILHRVSAELVWSPLSTAPSDINTTYITIMVVKSDLLQLLHLLNSTQPTINKLH